MDFTETLAILRETYGAPTLVLWGGLIIGIVTGMVLEISRFCLRSAVIEAVEPQGQRRPVQLTQFAAAMLTALVATQTLAAFGVIDLSQSIYHSAPLTLAGIIIGGLMFGVGMILTRGCVSRLIVLAGTGNLRAWVTLLVIAVASYATLRGLLAYPRLELAEIGPVMSAGHSFPEVLGVSAPYVAGALGLALLAVLGPLVRRIGVAAVAWGGLVGLAVTAAWWITGVVGFDEFEPTQLSGLSFTAPVAETLQYAMIATGDTLKFGIMVVVGMLAGAFLSALIGGRLNVVGFQSERAPLRYALGGVLMGFGGVTALGCTIGQGVSGISTLSIGSFVALAAIVTGAGIAHRLLEPSSQRSKARSSGLQPAE